MPNGTIGDHPISDITIHNIPTFGWEVDCLILDCVGIIDKLIVTGKILRPKYFYEKLEICDWYTPPGRDILIGKLSELRTELQIEFV